MFAIVSSNDLLNIYYVSAQDYVVFPFQRGHHTIWHPKRIYQWECTLYLRCLGNRHWVLGNTCVRTNHLGGGSKQMPSLFGALHLWVTFGLAFAIFSRTEIPRKNVSTRSCFFHISHSMAVSSNKVSFTMERIFEERLVELFSSMNLFIWLLHWCS